MILFRFDLRKLANHAENTKILFCNYVNNNVHNLKNENITIKRWFDGLIRRILDVIRLSRKRFFTLRDFGVKSTFVSVCNISPDAKSEYYILGRLGITYDGDIYVYFNFFTFSSLLDVLKNTTRKIIHKRFSKIIVLIIFTRFMSNINYKSLFFLLFLISIIYILIILYFTIHDYMNTWLTWTNPT